MSRFSAIAALAGALALLSPALASAATFNFADTADAYWSANSHEGSWQQVTGGTMTNAGTTITGAAATWNSGTSSNYYPFFDSSYGMGGRQAGLGVCHHGWTNSGVSQCSSNGGSYTADDNLTTSETLALSFNQKVMLSDLVVRDSNHYLIKNTADAIVINNLTFGTDANGHVILDGLGAATQFTFSTLTSGVPEIYLSTLSTITPPPVPLPAGIVLLPGALVMTGFFGRKRRKAA